MSKRICFVLVVVIFLVVLPGIHAQALGFDTVRISVQGSGRVYWTGTYNDAVYAVGFTDTDTEISLPHGAMVTFTAVADSGHPFNYWIVDSNSEGSNNPYTLWNTGASSTATIIADFYQAQNLAPNPPLQTPQPVQYDTIRVDAHGLGKVYWTANYLESVYTAGSTDTSTTITVPQGTIVTFTAVPTNAQFNKWIVNSADEGSKNPYILWSTGANPTATVTANFYQA